MLTDDDLTNELRSAFRADTAGMAYDGRRRPRRTPVVAVPLAAAGLTLGAVATVAGLSGGGPGPTASPVPASPTAATSTAAASPGMVTEDVTLAGYTVRLRHPADEPIKVRANFRDEVPAGLRKVTLPHPPGEAWVGKDPVSGDTGVFVRVATAHGGRHVFAILAEGASEDTLVDLVAGPPTPVPLTTD